MVAALAIYSGEEKRMAKLAPLLEKILDVDIERIVNADGTHADGVVQMRTNQGTALLLKEDGNEFGDGGCDPSTQAGLLSARRWVQSKVSECIVHHVLL
jgi:hypothetical protein